MPRKRIVSKRDVLPDSKFNSVLVSQFISRIMERGKKSVAERIFSNALEIIQNKTGQPGLEIFQKAVNNAKPVLEVKSRRVGGATYQIPVEVRPERRATLALRWLIAYARERTGMQMADKIAEELIAASKNEGASIKKKEDTHKMAEANKAFAHFRW